jgi:predicted transport protein
MVIWIETSSWAMAWEFDFEILEYSFEHNSVDKYIYFKFTNNFGVIIYCYVDNMIIISTNMNDVNDTKKYQIN